MINNIKQDLYRTFERNDQLVLILNSEKTIEELDYSELYRAYSPRGRIGSRAERCQGQFVTTAWYRRKDCSGCPQRELCCKAKDMDKAKEIVLRKTFWKKCAQAESQICTSRGIHLRLCRSIQVEGAFGLLKNDFAFRRFLTRGRDNIRTELFLLALAFNLKKLWMKRESLPLFPQDTML